MTKEDRSLQNTLDDGKRLWQLVSQYVKLDLVEKLSFVLTLLIVGGIVMALSAVAIYCFCMFIVTRMADSTGDLAMSYCIVGFGLLLLSAIIIFARKSLVVGPIIRSLMKEFFKESETEPNEE